MNTLVYTAAIDDRLAWEKSHRVLQFRKMPFISLGNQFV